MYTCIYKNAKDMSNKIKQKQFQQQDHSNYGVRKMNNIINSMPNKETTSIAR